MDFTTLARPQWRLGTLFEHTPAPAARPTSRVWRIGGEFAEPEPSSASGLPSDKQQPESERE